MLPFAGSESNPQSYNVACIKKSFFIWDLFLFAFKGSNTEVPHHHHRHRHLQKKARNHLQCVILIWLDECWFIRWFEEGNSSSITLQKHVICCMMGKDGLNQKHIFLSFYIQKIIINIDSMGGHWFLFQKIFTI